MTSVDLPEPLTPVTVVRTPSGIVTSMPLRLLARAPLTTMAPRVAGRRAAGVDDRALAAKIRAGQRPVPVGQQRRRRSLEDDVAAVLAGAGPEVDDVVGGANRLFVVLDDDDGVAEIAQPGERREQRAVVALVQADRRLVEDVEDAGQVRSDLRRQADALAFAAGERRGAAAERQVADADVVQEVQPIADLAQDAAGNQVLAIGQLERVEDLHGLGNRQVDVLGHRPALDAHRAALRLQPLAAAGRTRPQRAIGLEVLLFEPRARFVAPAQVGDEPFEPGAERILAAALLLDLVALASLGLRLDRVFGPPRARLRAVEEHVAHLLRQPAERHGQVDAEHACSASRAPP